MANLERSIPISIPDRQEAPQQDILSDALNMPIGLAVNTEPLHAPNQEKEISFIIPASESQNQLERQIKVMGFKKEATLPLPVPILARAASHAEMNATPLNAGELHEGLVKSGSNMEKSKLTMQALWEARQKKIQLAIKEVETFYNEEISPERREVVASKVDIEKSYALVGVRYQDTVHNIVFEKDSNIMYIVPLDTDINE